MRGEMSDAVREFRPVYAENPNATAMKMWYGFALLGVADYETLAEVGLPEHRMLALAALGQDDEARRTIYEIDVKSGFPQRVLRDIGVMFNAHNSSQEFIEYVNEQFGSLETLLESYPVATAWGAGYLSDLAYAYLQAGDEVTFRLLLEEMRSALDVQSEEGTDNWVSRLGEAQYAALQGDVDGAVAALQHAVDGGYKIANGLDIPVFDGIRNEPRLIEMAQAMADHVDAERAKLGMPPYRPVPATEEHEERSSFVN